VKTRELKRKGARMDGIRSQQRKFELRNFAKQSLRDLTRKFAGQIQVNSEMAYVRIPTKSVG
jgi:hypothetical protein